METTLLAVVRRVFVMALIAMLVGLWWHGGVFASSAATHSRHISCPADVVVGDDGHGTSIALTVDICALTVYASTTSGYSHTSIRVQDSEGNRPGVVKATGESAVTSVPLPYSCGVTYRGIVRTVHSDGTRGIGRTVPYKACASLIGSP